MTPFQKLGGNLWEEDPWQVVEPAITKDKYVFRNAGHAAGFDETGTRRLF